MRHQHRNSRLDRASTILDKTADMVGLLLVTIRDEETGIGFAGGSSAAGKITGGVGELTTTEGAALYAWQLSDWREELRDRIDGIVIAADQLDAWVRATLRKLRVPDGRLPPPLCGDGARDTRKPWDGHDLAWSPHSRDERNGWHDATCRRSAGRLGLCPVCLLRMNRWRLRNGLDWVSDSEQAA